ncbi:D-alanyl-D-alanine carboxypeptidase/D-alanyl-D-alanine-endopeptidase [Halorussus gelatinilyticus]|uniref:D-alanyl-D-alanine carboxypeptidase/D-alanyl-D-alanine-endopeptidase n=1 Tax=Halorussus gelatinilyticus TaxID=2937524 RepID=A0A8U0INC2_9EURY|nr:D-alanyl-D-alanine carboxypeptidase/D-alanyl-D-alanine-endopeptidase [Halorussus gelatinilyticus]UPW02101.1 D-alanyl-D-alanine carboxypeptidase/D-alanyl-D-alanine-endopeptidase [Halorussus gelatinilyticus]
MSDPTAPLAGIDGASVGVLAVARADGESVAAGDGLASDDGGGEALASLDPDRALAPASNTKLVTSALALEALGPGYAFETRVEGRGEREGNRLAGDLLVRGSGAPDLDGEDLRALADAVAAEVGAVAGDLLLDGTHFSGGRYGPGWTVGDRRYAYGAPSSALALAGNAVEVRISDPEESGNFRVSVVPDSPEIAVETDLRAVEAGGESEDGEADASDGNGDLRVVTDPDEGTIRVEGALPPGADRTERAPVVRPERHFGLALLDALESAGVSVEGEVRAVESADSTATDRDDVHAEEAFACAVESAPVADLLRSMNVPSDNFVAEQLARTVAAECDGEGSWAAWESIATDFLEECGAAACRLRDGSGLSRYNLVTARGMVGLLARADDAPWADAFFDSLPAPGEGTLSSRLDGADGLRAKTGTLTATCALSGVVRRDDDPDAFFSVVYGGLTVEADEARRRQDEFVRGLLK